MDLKDTESDAYFFLHIPMKQIILEVGKKKLQPQFPTSFLCTYCLVNKMIKTLTWQ